MSVKLIVFNNGLQIVGDVVGKDVEAGKVVVEKPVQVIMAPSKDRGGNDSATLGFAPFLQYSVQWKTGIPFTVADILTVVDPLNELVSSYNSTFGSGIILPPGIQSS